MKRVGILTFHSTTNHGASLQALGLVQALRGLGWEPEIIDYRPPLATKYYRTESWKRDRLANGIKYLRFARFTSKHLPLSPWRCDSLSELGRLAKSRYAALICGSDQIWHVNKSFRPFDPAYYLAFSDTPEVRRISYAASFGSPVKIDPFAVQIGNELKRFDALSVRDEHSQRWVNQLSGREAQLVADPTLLTDFDVPEPRGNRGSMDVFYGPHSARPAEAALRWSRMASGTLQCLAFPGPKGSRQRVSLGPLDWVQQIRQARMVFTTTFHGTVFAVKYGRPFVAMMLPWNVEKISDFVRRLGLEHRLLDAADLPQEIPQNLWHDEDVRAARGRVEEHVKRSLEYLRSSLTVGNMESQPILESRMGSA